MSKQITSPQKGILKLLQTSDSKPEKLLVSTRHGQITVFIYKPTTLEETHPVYINIHGGGFIMNYALQDDHICKYIAQKTGSIVINIDYATAPQNKYPIAHEQCIDVFEWVIKSGESLGINTKKIVIGGQSAGANLTIAIVNHAYRMKLPMPLLQIINYPALNLFMDPTLKHSPIKKPLITAEFMKMSNEVYVPNVNQRKDPMMSPTFLEDVKNLPKTLLTTTEYDTLKDEGEKFAERLLKEGVDVTYFMSSETDHFYTHNGSPEKTKELLDLMTNEINKVLK